MGVIHHNKLRVNAVVPDDPDQMAVLRESGWASGPHKDTDPDDPSFIPRVLDPESDAEEPEPEHAAKRTTRRK